MIFIIFSFEGFAKGSRLSYGVRTLSGNSNWFIVVWSKTVVNLQVAHFIGMPVLLYYIFKNTKLTVGLSIVYGLLPS